MITPTLNPTVQIANHQEVALERKDLAPCPLGIVGNLRYTAQEGGGVLAKGSEVLPGYLFG